MPKVSVILPIYNVEPYLQEALDSVVNQTLKDIEIICVNDGSKDNSLAIMQEYAEKDNRIKIISKPNSGYGHTMNVGIDAATGEYIGIVEPDDYVKLDMYETLYNLAEANQVDLIKADFYRFKGNGKELKLEYNQLSKDKSYYGKVLDPKENLEVFRFIMNTWSGIYKREFLNKYHIRHNETPGASFQDNGFWFQTFCRAERIYFVNQPFYMNRRDNPNSSVHDRGKVYCASEEYKYIYDFLEKNPELKERYIYMYSLKKFHNYNFTMSRIGEEFYQEFLQHYSEEFRKARNNGELDKKLFSQNEWKKINEIIESPDTYYKKYYVYKNGEAKNKNEMTKNIAQKALYCLKNEGIMYTLNKIKEKLLG